MIDLKGNPFYLKDEDIEWVENIKSNMTENDMIGQLFMLESISGNVDDLKPVLEKFVPGGLMHRPNLSQDMKKTTDELQRLVDIPLLVAGNVCHGLGEICFNEQVFTTNMGVGATNNSMHAYRQGVMCGEGCNEVGINWTFAPVADINMNYMSSVIGTRSYGANAKQVSEMAAAYTKGVQENGVAACFKHFPGDGVDFRDQHVTPSVNSLSCEEWDDTFGKVYEKQIEEGALTCMIGHITMPAYSMRLNPSLTYGECLPASYSKELLTGLLREKLGFNGLVVTDAAQMAGMCASLPREVVVPLTIEAGCDMFLFYCDFFEDAEYMKNGLTNGILSHERLEEAVTRILALKAALGLHKQTRRDSSYRKNQQIFDDWTTQACCESVTLVKNLRDDLFPITPERYPKIIMYSHVSENIDPPVMRPEMGKFAAGDKEKLFRYFVEKMRKQGFDIEIYTEELGIEKKINAYHSREKMKQYDLSIHFANVEKEHGRAERLVYKGHCANDAPYTDMYVPNILISVTSPFLLADAPRVKTCINCYSNTEKMVDILIEKLIGKSAFIGVSPVDPFCGLEDTKW